MACTSPMAALPTSALVDYLPAALADPNLITLHTAHQLAHGLVTLVNGWPPSAQFGALYLARLLAAASDAAADAMIRVQLPAALLGPSGPLGGSVAAGAREARGGRLMSLALLSNLASRPAGAAALLGVTPLPLADGVTPDREAVKGVDVHGIAFGVGAQGGADGADRQDGVADEIARRLVAVCIGALHDTSDAAVTQMGAALAYNLSLHLACLSTGAFVETQLATERGALASAVRLGAAMCAPLLPAIVAALPSFTDSETLGRAISVLGHMLHARDDEAVAVALSLDTASVLVAVRRTAAASGHLRLIDEVAALIEVD